MSSLPSFAEFFEALWRKAPFPWQRMLAQRVADREWPDAIDLPTASGKTACLDIAVYALAAQADQPLGRRTAPRRIWFVVDRRIVVDEAFERAKRLAHKLMHETDPAIRAVADRLLRIRGLPSCERPLAIGRLRGGVLRDDRWARIPSQPSVIASTVDQFGSRLLFRGYGPSLLAAPIYAGLTGNDSLVLLDEAHCAVPFLQTLHSVKRFRSSVWTETQKPTPFHVAILSATPPEKENERPLDVFPSEAEREAALAHSILQQRLRASKLARLELVKDGSSLVEQIAQAARQFARSGCHRVGVIVNRVGHARAVAARLREIARTDISDDAAGSAFDVELLTGRIRPVERDALVGDRLCPVLHSSSTQTLPRSLVLVATQCLEVGADFSFDSLVTECASLDALRQRFGRLDRLGQLKKTSAFIFVAESSLEETDPIYGDASRNTWEFLQRVAEVTKTSRRKETRTVDLGVNALSPKLPPADGLRALLAPSPDAPVLLPAHLDLLCQTSPRPHPEPDINLFLHGKGRSRAEIRVVWRCDLDLHHPEQWAEIVSLCRPVSGEMLSVPLYRFRQWLRDRQSSDTTGDVEGVAAEAETERASRLAQDEGSAFLLWRGRDHSEVGRDPDQIPPDSVVILPVPERLAEAEALGQILCQQGFGQAQLDLWEVVSSQSGRPAVLRLNRDCLAPWLGEKGCVPLRGLLSLLDTEDWTVEELRDAVRTVVGWVPETDDRPSLPAWLRERFAAVTNFRLRDCAAHPAGGFILHARVSAVEAAETDFFADEDDQGGEALEEVPLAAHTVGVVNAAQKLGVACLGESATPILAAAARWHDLGKLDPRFQSLLRGRTASTDDAPLAKSSAKPQSPERTRAVREAVGLPTNFRHEMLSLQLVERDGTAQWSSEEFELLLHLIASHHGHGRPFAPVCEDKEAPPLKDRLASLCIELDADSRRALPAPHLLDSGVSDRFWALTRRFGWWGLAYREAILRLADWHVSAHPSG